VASSGTSRLQAVGEREAPTLEEMHADMVAAPPTVGPGMALGMVLLGIKTLSQRALVMIGSLANLALCASVWWLFVQMPDNPSWPKIAANAGYGIFVLTAIFLTRRR